MNHSIIATRYAKALMLVGADNQCLDNLKADMELLSVTIRENPTFRHVLENPVIKHIQKRKVMIELLEKWVHPMTLNFISTLIHNRRDFMLDNIARNFIDLYEKHKGIKRAHVVSATEMGDQSKQQMKQQLSQLFQADFQMTAETNPDLIGGFILRIGDQQYDASLSSGLKRMKKKLIEK